MPFNYVHLTTPAYVELTNGSETTLHSHAGGITAGEILVADGQCAPPVMLTNETECDFLYQG